MNKLIIKENFQKIWKDPVWSKIISAAIIFISATLWVRYNNYSFQEIVDSVLMVLAFQIPIYFSLSLFGIYFITVKVNHALKKKIDPIWDERIGNYSFRELYNILKGQNLPIQTAGMHQSGRKAPEENLLNLFHVYSIVINAGVDIDKAMNDGGYMYGVFCPKMLSYGLVDKIDKYDKKLDITRTKFQTSELGYKFHSLLEKVIQKNLTDSKVRN